MILKHENPGTNRYISKGDYEDTTISDLLVMKGDKILFLVGGFCTRKRLLI
jgi:hypothetical protein